MLALYNIQCHMKRYPINSGSAKHLDTIKCSHTVKTAIHIVIRINHLADRNFRNGGGLEEPPSRQNKLSLKTMAKRLRIQRTGSDYTHYTFCKEEKIKNVTTLQMFSIDNPVCGGQLFWIGLPDWDLGFWLLHRSRRFGILVQVFHSPLSEILRYTFEF